MALVVALLGDRALEGRLAEHLNPRHDLAMVRSWPGLLRMIRERPVTGAVVELGSLPLSPSWEPLSPSWEAALGGLRSHFPRLGLVLLVRRHGDPSTLFRMGRAGIQNLVLLSLDNLDQEVGRAMARSAEGSATSLVTRFLSPYLPRRELRMAALGMDNVHKRWSAEEFAGEAGLSRPFLSERFREHGLPSAGHFLLWARLFHAGHWLEEPGRTGESVSRQLEYSSGSAFRRALRHYAGATPMEVRAGGGLRLLMRRFLRRQGLGAPRDAFRVGRAGRASERREPRRREKEELRCGDSETAGEGSGRWWPGGSPGGSSSPSSSPGGRSTPSARHR